jgi:hypothetical protein
MTARQAPTSALRSAGRALFIFLTLLFLTVGLFILYAGLQNYLDSESHDGAFSNTLLGVSLVSIPLAFIFTARAVKSYKKSRSQYELPDTPLYFFIQTFVSAGFMLISITALMLYLIYVLF